MNPSSPFALSCFTKAIWRFPAQKVTNCGVLFPALAFPNHYSIATGLFPTKDRQHFFSLNDPASVGDGCWCGGEPAWVAVESSGMVAASFFFIGSVSAVDIYSLIMETLEIPIVTPNDGDINAPCRINRPRRLSAQFARAPV
jgi:hypothetical protein